MWSTHMTWTNIIIVNASLNGWLELQGFILYENLQKLGINMGQLMPLRHQYFSTMHTLANNCFIQFLTP